ncbi:MAG: DMT family transporter [Clostridiales bacterium]|nr:DMT family transporter [Clostridiales bacterium]
MKKQLKGSLSLLCGTFIWGSAFIAQSVGMDLIGPFTFQAIRCMLAVIFLFLITLIFDWKIGIQQSLSKWKSKRLWMAGGICGCALFVAASLQQIGLVYTDPGKAGFLTAMYIVLVPMLGIFVHRRPGLNAVISVVLALVGLYLLSFMGVTSINVGDLFLIGGALGFAVQILLIDRFAQDLDGLRLNCVQALVVAVLSVPFMLLTEELDMGNILACWLPLGFAGILSMGVAYSLQIVGQKNLEPTTASLIMSLESVFAALGGWLILHNTMTPRELCGCGLVFAGVIISQLPTKKQTV